MEFIPSQFLSSAIAREETFECLKIEEVLFIIFQSQGQMKHSGIISNLKFHNFTTSYSDEMQILDVFVFP